MSSRFDLIIGVPQHSSQRKVSSWSLCTGESEAYSCSSSRSETSISFSVSRKLFSWMCIAAKYGQVRFVRVESRDGDVFQSTPRVSIWSRMTRISATWTSVSSSARSSVMRPATSSPSVRRGQRSATPFEVMKFHAISRSVGGSTLSLSHWHVTPGGTGTDGSLSSCTVLRSCHRRRIEPWLRSRRRPSISW